MGNGKTTLLKNGLAKVLNRPFHLIQLGGVSDSSFLAGHSYTYEGSLWGKIVDVITQSRCMNPIIYFDELDKISETNKGSEIISILTHLTDSSQNSHFQDKYFSGIDIDLSNVIFVFSFNHAEKINKILLDRINIIYTKGFNTLDKIKITRQFLIKEICDNINFNSDNIEISDDTLQYIINNYTKEEGVRSLKKCLHSIYSKINLLSMIAKEDYQNFNISYKIKKI